MTHKELALRGIYWLYEKGCQVYANEVPTNNGYADALGVKCGQPNLPDTVYYIEAKASRSDLICKKQKSIYRNSVDPYLADHIGVDFYYLIVNSDMKIEPTLYPEWGIIQNGCVTRRAKRIKRNNADAGELIKRIGHVLVYKVFGKLYLPGVSNEEWKQKIQGHSQPQLQLLNP